MDQDGERTKKPAKYTKKLTTDEHGWLEGAKGGKVSGETERKFETTNGHECTPRRRAGRGFQRSLNTDDSRHASDYGGLWLDPYSCQFVSIRGYILRFAKSVFIGVHPWSSAFRICQARSPCLCAFVVQLLHRELGGAGKPPLVILHGLLGSSRNWQTAGKDLAQWFHVFALDLRNHGASPHADEMTYDTMIDDVLAWMDARSLSRVSMLGHSMGGKVAMRLACRHGERVERLVIVDIAPKDYRWAAHRAEFAAMNELQLEHLQSRAEAELRFEARVDDWAMRKFLTTNLERTAGGGWKWMVNLPVLTAALPELEKNSVGEGDRFDGPVLFVVGERSNYVQREDWEAARRYFPQADFRVVKGSGHNPHMETREEFVRIVAEATKAGAAEQRGNGRLEMGDGAERWAG